MRKLRIGKHAVPLWLIVVLLISAVGAVVLTEYLLNVNIPVKVQEPLEITDYPSELSLFPGETKEFNVTVYNHASVNYSVMLDMSLNDSTYQNNYVKFNDEIFAVVPGQQDIATWFSVKSSAPATNASLNINLKRLENISDSFDSTILGSQWSTIDPDGGSSFNLSAHPGWLRITTTSPPGRDLLPSKFNAPRIAQSITEDFTIETKISSVTDENDEGAGILVWTNSTNYVRLDRMSRLGGQQVLFGGSVLGIFPCPGDTSVVLSLNINPTYLRLVRTNNTLSGYHSSDGITWIPVGDIPFAVSYPVCIGLEIVNEYHAGTFFADFDYFKITTR